MTFEQSCNTDSESLMDTIIFIASKLLWALIRPETIF